MKNNRNIRADKMYFNNGKWETVYTEDNIKRLAYYNIDVPHVVGIGTNTPFSKLSFGDSSDSGHHVSGILTPGKVTAIALHEKTTNIDNVKKEGQEFTGLSYVTNLRSIRQLQNNTQAKGLAFYSNKTSDTEDTSLRTDQGIMYITDDKYIHIGGEPKGYNLIDTRGINRKIPAATQETGPSILLDVSGSIHVNGFINFLKNGNETVNYLTDNPANQMTYRDGEIKYIDPNSTSPSDQDTDLTLGSVPEGAIWVGFEKPLSSDTTTTSLAATPRLYLMRAGKATRVLIEGDAAAGAGGGTTGGLTFDGSTDSNNNNTEPYYVFRNTSQVPGNTMINTYVGYPSNSSSISAFGSSNNPMPTFIGSSARASATPADPPAVLSIIGGLAVFDSTKGGTHADYLDYKNTNFKLTGNKQILESDIYTHTSGTEKKQSELGTIYMDRHLMIGGCNSSNGRSDAANPQPFKTMSSAIDVSGGIINKPLIRSITGSARTSGDSSLVTQSVNAQDSIIVGNTTPAKFSGDCKESLVMGSHDGSTSGAKLIDNENNIIMGKNCESRYISESLVVGKDCVAGPGINPSTTGDSIKRGVVALGESANANNDPPAAGIDNTDIRFAFGANNDVGQSGNVFTIDKKGNVVIQGPKGFKPTAGQTGHGEYGNLTVDGNLLVKGNYTELEVTRVLAKDVSIDLNAITNSSGGSEGATSAPNGGGIRLFTTDDTTNAVSFTYDNSSSRNVWTTGKGSGHGRGDTNSGMAAGGDAGQENFLVDKVGNVNIGYDSNITDKYHIHISSEPGGADVDRSNVTFYTNQGMPSVAFKRQNGEIDVSGALVIDDNAKKLLATATTSGGALVDTNINVLTIGGGYTSSGNQGEGFELEHEYVSSGTKKLVNMKLSGETVLGGTTSDNGMFRVRHWKDMNDNTKKSEPIVEIDEGKLKGGTGSGTDNFTLLHVSGGYDHTAAHNGLDMILDRQFITGVGTERRVNLRTGGTLTVDGCNKNLPGSSGTETIAQFFEDYDPTNSKYGVVIDISENSSGVTKANLKIAGKLTVDGLIDPIGLVLDHHGATNPNGDTSSSKTTIWNDNGVLKFQKGGDTTISTIATTSTTGTSGSSVAGNTDAANKIAISKRGNKSAHDTFNYRLLFTDEGPTTGNNAVNCSVYIDDEATATDGGLRYNPVDDELMLTILRAEKLTTPFVSGTSGPRESGFVKVDTNGVINAGLVDWNSDISSRPAVLVSDDHILLDKNGDHNIKVTDASGNHGYHMNIQGSSGTNPNSVSSLQNQNGGDINIDAGGGIGTGTGGKVVISAGNGGSAGGDIELIPGDNGAGNVRAKICVEGDIVENRANRNLILDTQSGQKIQANKELNGKDSTVSAASKFIVRGGPERRTIKAGSAITVKDGNHLELYGSSGSNALSSSNADGGNGGNIVLKPGEGGTKDGTGTNNGSDGDIVMKGNVRSDNDHLNLAADGTGNKIKLNSTVELSSLTAPSTVLSNPLCIDNNKEIVIGGDPLSGLNALGVDNDTSNVSIKIKQLDNATKNGGNLTISAQSVKSGSTGKTGGNIILQASSGSTTAENGTIQMNGKITTASGANLEIEPAGAGLIQANKAIISKNAQNLTLTATDTTTTSGAAAGVTITAAGGTGSATGGNITLTPGGSGSTAGSIVMGGTIKPSSGNLTLGANIDFEAVDADRTITAPERSSTTDAVGNDIIIKSGNRKGSGNHSCGNVVIDFGTSSSSGIGQRGALIIKKHPGATACNLRSEGANPFNITSGYDTSTGTGISGNANINIKPANAGVIQIGGTNPTIQTEENTKTLSIKTQDVSTGGAKGINITAGSVTQTTGNPNHSGGDINITSGNSGTATNGANINLTTGHKTNATGANLGGQGNIICDATSITAPAGAAGNDGDSLTIKGGNGTTSSGSSQNGGDLILKGGSLASGGNAGNVHIKNYPIIQDFTIWNDNFSNLDSTNVVISGTSTSVSYIKAKYLLGGIVRIGGLSTDPDLYFPPASEFNSLFPNATVSGSTFPKTTTAFKCSIHVVGPKTYNSGTGYRIDFKNNTGLVVYNNSSTTGTTYTSGLPTTITSIYEKGHVDILIAKETTTSSGNWSITFLS